MKKITRTHVVIAVLTLIGFITVLYVLFQISKLRTFQFFGDLTHQVETEQKVIAITFDDGPTVYTPEILDVLQNNGIKATFFVMGSEIEKHPQITKQIVEEGHQLANHSYSHKRMVLKSQDFIDYEIQTTNELIRDAGYEGEIYFRPPTGKKLLGLPWYLKQHDIHTIMWDVEPDTYINDKRDDETNEDFIVRYTLENTKPGSILLLHPWCEGCGPARAAIPRIIDELQSQGYRFVTVSELLGYTDR